LAALGSGAAPLGVSLGFGSDVTPSLFDGGMAAALAAVTGCDCAGLGELIGGEAPLFVLMFIAPENLLVTNQHHWLSRSFVPVVKSDRGRRGKIFRKKF